jgi:ubiquinone/menaquinone biosynthesis C-methylase UbiE
MTSSHDDRVRREFTRQAEAYAASPSIGRPELVDWLPRLTEARAGLRVLDVACGPGHVLLAFARHGCFAAGVDLTPHTLRVAQHRLPDASATLVCGHVESLPFRERSFDLVVCRSAFHHFANPAAALAAMLRLARPGGRVATLDHVTSENRAEAGWHHRIERLRDPSHAACLSPSSFRRLYREARLAPDREESAAFEFDFAEWYERGFQGPKVGERLRSMLLDHPGGGVPGMRVTRRDPLAVRFDFLALSAPVR